MAKFRYLLLGAGAALALAGCGQSPSTTATVAPAPVVDQAAEAAKARLAQQDANVKVAEAFFKPGISMDDRLNLMSPDYVQHNPAFVRFGEINNVQGKDAFKLFVDTLTKLHGGGNPFGPPPGAKGPKPPQGDMFYKVTADGDLVTILHKRYRPDPQNKGKFYEAYGFDTFRIQDGKLAEHWDDATIPEPLPVYLKTPVKSLKFPKQTKQPGAD